MLFKNLIMYNLSTPLNLTSHELHLALKEHEFAGCSDHEPKATGWVPVLPGAIDYEDEEMLAHQIIHRNNPAFMLAYQKREKILPASVVNAEVNYRVKEIQGIECRKLGRKERAEFKEEVIRQLMPRAFSRDTITHLIISGSWIFINSSSSNHAEEILKELRVTLGSLPVTPFTTQANPAQVFTHWLSSATAPMHFKYGEYCKLVDNAESTATVVCKNQSIDTLEVRQHIDTGMHVAVIGLQYEESINFRVSDELIVSGIHYTDIFADKVFDNLDIDEATAVQFFDADFLIMLGEFKRIRTALTQSIDDNEY